MPTKQQFVALSAFKHQLARFIRLSTGASNGLTRTQYLLLLHIAGRSEREWATVGELAECLQSDAFRVADVNVSTDTGAHDVMPRTSARKTAVPKGIARRGTAPARARR